MATSPPAAKRFKQEVADASGYLVQLSPKKLSARNNPYMKGTLQTSVKDYQDVVVYDMSKQSNLEEFAKTKSPVKLKNVAVEDQTLIVKRQTQIVKLPVLNFHYDAKTTKTYTIADLLKDSPLDKTLVDIKLAKVLHIHPAVLKTIPYTNEKKKVTPVIIGDPTGHITLSVWTDIHEEQLPVEKDKVFKLENLSFRNWNGGQLSSTKSSVYTSVNQKLKVNKPNIETTSMYQTLQGVFVTVESTTVSLCIACNSREPSPSTHFYKCKVCNCKQLVSNMKKNTDLKGKFKPLDDSPLIHLSLNNHQLTWLPDTDVNNIDGLEEQLLQTSMTITYNKVNNYVETTSPIDSV